jgi:oxaloacetate decarboxylase gamma subunit
MTIVEMLGQSGILTLLGMGIVSVFLLSLVIVINQAGKFFNAKRLDHASTSSVNAAKTKAGSALAGISNAAAANATAHAATDATTCAAISAAVTEYRKGKQYV